MISFIKSSSILDNRRIILISFVIVAIAVSFWSTSRYPTLQGKADMTGIINLEDTLTHEAYLIIEEEDPLYKKVAYTTVNWAWANRQGMFFAVLLASAFMALFKYLPRYRSRNRFLNSIYGLVTGTPLGVCVNCVAPIAKAMYEGGRSLQTSLAVLFSSPTLNIIVLTMLFTLFPFYLAVIKLGFTIFLILVIVPFLSGKEESIAENIVCAIPDLQETSSESWGSAIHGILKDYWDSFVYIVVRTVPLMFVAGFLGALVSHVWDPNTMIGEDPSLLAIIAIGVFGTFLPMPIAFDVMLAQSLFAANVPIVVVMTLLFTLGTFSVYSGFIIWRTFNYKLAILLFCIVTGLGIIAGYFAQEVSDFKKDRREKQYEQQVLNYIPKETNAENSEGPAEFALYGLETTQEIRREIIYKQDDLTIERSSFIPQTSSIKKYFTKYSGPDYGIDSYNEISEFNFIEPYLLGRGLASGDFNNDGWVDLLVAETGKVDLYQNINGEKFKKVHLDVPELTNKDVFFVAMADLNRDGWLDFYATTFGSDNYLIINPLAKTEIEQNVYKLDNNGTLLTMSVSIGDINNDGWLDLFHGNWNGGEIIPNPGPKARNVMLLNHELKFSPFPMAYFDNEDDGNTLTSLLSDINQDGLLDLMVGNDFEIPDRFYANIQGERFDQIIRKHELIPGSPILNMSIDTADFNNDLLLDVYMTGGSWVEAPANQSAAVKFKDSEFCTKIEDPTRRIECEKIWMLSRISLVKEFMECEEMREDFGDDVVRGCLVAERVHNMKWAREEACKKIPSTFNTYQTFCEAVKDAPERVRKTSNAVKQIPVMNILLENDGSGKFVDTSDQKDVHYGAWSWAGKFADLDKDGWQDIYIANGAVYASFVGPTTHTPNMYYQNRNGETFSMLQTEYGLDDLSHSSAYTYLDIDNDGDLDIVGNTTHGGFNVFINHSIDNQSVIFEFRDEVGNTHCIGCKIYVAHGESENESKQLREIKAGGGFLSFDAPAAHFGLGKDKKITRLGIDWSTGERTRLSQEFEAGYKYIITRKK